jgi:DNA-binding winged helix-turn-helix (wHTH) protein
MTDKIVYEFGDFRLNPLRRTLLFNDDSRSLTPTAFDLLVIFVQSHGQTLSKTELIKRVWGDVVVTDNNFSVTLNAVRRALDESAKQPRSIQKAPGGYRFIADVREIREEPGIPASQTFRDNAATKEEMPKAFVPRRHLLHTVVSSCVLAALYAISVFLEVAYEFDRFGSMAWRITPFIFAWVALSSILGLTVDRKLTLQGKANGLVLSIAIFFAAATILFLVLTRFLPSFPITQSTLQSYPAQAAYLKNTAYFLVLTLCFLIAPFHFILSMEREIEQGRFEGFLRLLTGSRLRAAPRGTIYPRFWAVTVFLVVLAAFSLVMTSNLLDHLKPANHMNLFIQLVYMRGILYFGLGIECLMWYYLALQRLKRAGNEEFGNLEAQV